MDRHCQASNTYRVERDMNIVPQEYWDNSYQDLTITKAPDNDPISQLIKKYIPAASPGEQAFEIGCYPGRFLTIFGELGYVLNGVDTTPKVTQLPAELNKLGYQTGDFFNSKFEETAKKKYNAVASFGFIEHFVDWKNVITNHVDFLEDNGYLIITTPNFKGFWQNLYHNLLDKTNLNRHVVKSMSPQKWKSLLERSGLQVIAYGHTGFDFWDETPYKNKIQRGIKKIILGVSHYIHKQKPFHSSVAAYCYIVAKKA